MYMIVMIIYLLDLCLLMIIHIIRCMLSTKMTFLDTHAEEIQYSIYFGKQYMISIHYLFGAVRFTKVRIHPES